MKPIPVLGIPVVNRADLLHRCIRSIDYPVESLVIVNNGEDRGVAALLEQLLYEHDYGFYPFVERFETYKPAHNLGVAGSWNWIIASHPAAAWWELVGNDIQFTRGDLAKISAFVESHLDYVTMPANWGHSLFAVTRAGIEQIGWFDENYYPAYSEDQDHMYRVKLAGAKWQDVPDIHAVHGEPPLWGSSTVWSDQKLLAKCRAFQPANLEYYKAKWGGHPGREEWTHPYDNPSLSLRDWLVHPAFTALTGNPLKETPQHTLCMHEWIPVTVMGDACHKYICSQCSAQNERPFSPEEVRAAS